MKKVFIGMSGGVDSAVSAALLQQQGFTVVGVFLKVWPARTTDDVQSGGEPKGIPCTWREDRREAMRVAAHLGIPLVTWDLSAEYKGKIVDYMLGEYKAGRTPNPDVMCNKEIKFGVFYDRARRLGADYVATGHYAQIKNGELHTAKDTTKDQSYFLWTLKPEILAHTLFPVGGLLKTEVRKLAKKFKLPNAERKDSQGLCFIGKFDFKEFLQSQLKPKKGEVLNEQGQVIGEHNGAVLYTLGERHGFTITAKTPSDEPYYIVEKNIKDNTLTVSTKPKSSAKAKLEVELEKVNWLVEPQPNKTYLAQIRYHGQFLPCQLQLGHSVSKLVKVKFKEAMTDLASGQSIVIYDKSLVVGGGVIC